MRGRATVVLDVGKTLSKAGLWNARGELVDRRARPNARKYTGRYVALDAEGIRDFFADALSDFARIADVGAIVPVAHGAAAAVIGEDGLALPPLDYEQPLPAALRADYDRLRDPFDVTGSPRLPDGLNLGAQLYYLESVDPDLLSEGRLLLPWPQYWSWLFSGVAASELTSLGCHTDLWRPLTGMPSRLAIQRGWAGRLGPLRHAGAALGPMTCEWRRRTGLSSDVQVHCGLHDSNAALTGARAFPEIAGHEATVLSTGTWFVAMRTPGSGASLDIAGLQESRDCLVNVDVAGRCIPSARFMGGREIELLTGLDARQIDIRSDQPELLNAVAAVLADGSMVLPTLTPGCGPFAAGRGRWSSMPADQAQRRAAICLYVALVADAALELIGTGNRLLVEGRFAECEVFIRALATLRPDLAVYVGHQTSGVSFGALSLLIPDLRPVGQLVRVVPLPNHLGEYRRQWRKEAERVEDAAA